MPYHVSETSRKCRRAAVPRFRNVPEMGNAGKRWETLGKRPRQKRKRFFNWDDKVNNERTVSMNNCVDEMNDECFAVNHVESSDKVIRDAYVNDSNDVSNKTKASNAKAAMDNKIINNKLWIVATEILDDDREVVIFDEELFSWVNIWEWVNNERTVSMNNCVDEMNDECFAVNHVESSDKVIRDAYVNDSNDVSNKTKASNAKAAMDNKIINNKLWIVATEILDDDREVVIFDEELVGYIWGVGNGI
ncbi:hypothetical protein Tco_1137504 [Tanacetum coccineum]